MEGFPLQEGAVSVSYPSSRTQRVKRYATRLVLHLSMVFASVAPTCAVVLWAGAVLFVVLKSLARSTQCPLCDKQMRALFLLPCTAAS
jgi:hypothetical protein